MASTRGFSCDGPDCKTFETAEPQQRMPVGWIEVLIPTHQDHTEGRFELCSNKCLAKLAKARMDAERETTPLHPAVKAPAPQRTVTTSDAHKQAGRYGAHKRLHGPNNVRTDCEWCQGADAPNASGKAVGVPKLERTKISDPPKVGEKLVKVGDEWLPPLPTNGRARVGHRTNHVNKNVVNPDCLYCKYETAVTNERDTSAG